MDVILRKYFWVINLITIGICAGFAGRAVASMVFSAVLTDGPPAPGRYTPPPPETRHAKDINLILERNVFCSTCAPQTVTPDQAVASTGPLDTTPQRSALQLQLLATMTSGNTDWDQAVIRDTADANKRVGIFRRGDKLPVGQAVVAQVVPHRVYLVNGTRVEYIDQDGTAPPPTAAPGPVAAAEPTGDANSLDKDVEKGIRCSGANCEVDKSLVDKVMANTTALATSARFVPSMRDGKPNGFKVYAIRPGSVFAKLGMQNADLVKSINGLDMSSPDKALEAYTKLKTASHLTLQVERRGENVTMDYQIR